MSIRAYCVRAVAGLGALLALMPLPAAAQNSFTYTLLPLPGFLSIYPYGSWANPTGINAAGEVAGYYGGYTADFSRQEQGLLWDIAHNPAALFQDSYPITSFFSRAVAINDAGTIGGQAATDPDYATSAPFLYSTGSYTLLDTMGQSGEIAALNNNNQSVGGIYPNTGYPGSSTTASVFWDANGAATAINPPGGQNWAYGINDAGLVVGETNQSYLDPPNQPFAWTSLLGAYLLPVGSSVGGGAHAVNNQGDVAGYLETMPHHGADHAAIWHNGLPIDIQTFGVASRALGMNDAGAVIGWIYLQPISNDFPYPYGFYYANGKIQTLLSMMDETFPYNHLDVTAIGPDGSVVAQPYNMYTVGYSRYFTFGPPVLLTPSQIVLPHPTEVTHQLRIRIAPQLVYDPTSKLWNRKATLTNLSNTTLPGPFDVVFDGINADNGTYNFAVVPDGGFVLVNAPKGASFSRFTIPGNALPPGASVSLDVGFALPALQFGRTNYTITHVYAGPGRP